MKENFLLKEMIRQILHYILESLDSQPLEQEKAISLASSSICSPNAVQKLGKSQQCPFYSSVQRTSGSDLWRVQISFRSLHVLLSAKSSHKLGVEDSGSENLA